MRRAIRNLAHEVAPRVAGARDRLAAGFWLVVLAVLPLASAPAQAPDAMLPLRLGDFYQTAKAQPYKPADPALFEEYGFDAGERALFTAGEKKLEVTAIRANDPTGAIAIYEWLRPADGKPVQLGERAVEAGDETCTQLGNYVVILKGASPDPDVLNTMLSVLPRYQHGAEPPLLHEMPKDGLVPNTERYVLGPVSLQRLAPFIPPSVAAFHLGAEAQMAEYQAGGARLKMMLFSYPTPHLARQQLEDFQKVSKVMAKRSGLLIGVVLNPSSADEAERLLAHVRYEATLSWDQPKPTRRDNVGDLILNNILLCVIIAGIALIAGVALVGGRFLLAKLFPGHGLDASIDQQIIRLHLSDK